MQLMAADIVPTTVDEIEGPECPTKRKLIASAENLFGRVGIEGASLQQIAICAGQANKYAVQYHFANKEGMIDAIFRLRLRHIDRRRNELLSIATEMERLSDPIALMEILFLPISEQIDAEGHHSYARFILQFITRVDYANEIVHPLPSVDSPMSATIDHIGHAFSMSAPTLQKRLFQTTLAMFAVLIERDNNRNHGRATLPLRDEIVDAIALGALMLSASEGLHLPGGFDGSGAVNP